MGSLITLVFLVVSLIFTLNFEPLLIPLLSLIWLINTLPTDHNSLDDVAREWLTRPVTVSEIFRTLKSMAKGKSPGPDGLNVKFYFFYWEIVKEPLFRAISHFSQLLPSHLLGVKLMLFLFLRSTPIELLITGQFPYVM